jgi:signal transduction histidine kinase/integral membrane sensor domain MASE1
VSFRAIPVFGTHERAGWGAGHFVRITATGFVVFAAYYLGTILGSALRLPPDVTSVLWPPNSILTATLLLSPPRRWPIYLLAALPAHLLVELREWPLPLVLALFATNCSEALFGAIGVRLLGGTASSLFDSLRGIGIFFVAVVLAGPLLSSFLDAAAVHGFHGEPYWVVWRNRQFSNVLSELTIVPTIVIGVTRGVSAIRATSALRLVEAISIVAGIVLVGIVVFVEPYEHAFRLPGAFSASLAFLLPFILWAAVRFGTGGASLALLVSALLAIGATAQRRGPFGALPPRDKVIGLQLVFLAVAVPVQCLAALLVERDRTGRQLAQRLRFEELLSRLSQAFVLIPSDQIGPVFQYCLARIGEFHGVDCALLVKFTDGPRLHEPEIVETWIAPSCEDLQTTVVVDDFPWVVDRLRQKETVIAPNVDALPAEASRDREAFQASGLKSGLAIPLIAGDRVIGALVLASKAERGWSEGVIIRVHLLAEVLTNALSRKQADDAMHAIEHLRAELAHVSRVATLGELTVSLAHQLNQPLTAILSNAQAARRLLTHSPPDLEELRAILSDIVDDDTRAADIIKHVRSLLKKGEPELMPVDVNSLVQGVARLVSTDAIRRHVSLTMDLAPGLVLVQGDRVQLQQALLNLLLNAFDAVSDGGDGRCVHVRVERVDGRHNHSEFVQVSVIDSGVGFADGRMETAFEPFYTTKIGGMGMGLPIARSIIEAHAGRIRVMNNEGGGATVQFTLPAVGSVHT